MKPLSLPLLISCVVCLTPHAIAAPQTYDPASANGDAWNLLSLNWDASATAWINDNDAIFGGTGEPVSVTGAITANAISFTATGYSLANNGGSLALTGPATLSTDTGVTATISQILSGTNGLVKNGEGTIVLTSDNTVTGGVNINAGTLDLANPANNAIGTLRGTVNVNTGGTLRLSTANSLGYNTAWVNVLNINGGLVDNIATGDNGWNIGISLTGGTLQSNGGTTSGTSTQLFSLGGNSTITTLASDITSTIAGRINLREGNTGDVLPFTIADGAAATDLNVTATITPSGGTRGITKSGPGTMALTAANTFTGNTTINEGTLVFGRNGGADGVGTIRGPLVINPGTTALSTAHDSLGWQTGTRVTAITINGGSLNHNPNINLSLWGAPVTMTAGTIAATALNLANNRIDIGNGSSIATLAADTSSFINGRFHLRQANTNITVANGAAAEDLVINAAILSSVTNAKITKAGDGTLVLRNTLSGAGGSTWNAGIMEITGGKFILDGTNVTPTDGNALSFILHPGTTLETGANTIHNHFGAITMDGATIHTAAGTGQYDNESYQLRGDLTVIGTAPSFITRDIARTDANSGIALVGNRTFNIADATSSAAADLIIRTEIEQTTGIPGALIKTGPGTLLADGVNLTYTGNTTISEGTLALSGNSAITGATSITTIASGATLDVQATTSSTHTVTTNQAITGNGTIQGNLDLQGSYLVDISGPSASHLTVNGNLDLTNALIDFFELPTGVTQPVYIIATYQTLTGAETLQTTGLPDGYTLDTNYNSANQIAIVGTPPGYYAWAGTKNLTGDDSLPTADPDADGIPNLLEFVLGGEPLTSDNTILPQVALIEDEIRFTFQRSDESESPVTTQTFQWSTDLETWNDIPLSPTPGPEISISENAAALDDITITLPSNLAPDGQIFGRLRVSQ